MAQLIAEVQGNRGSVHRLGSKIVRSKLASWKHRIDTFLDNEGNYKIEISEIGGKTLKLIEDNVIHSSEEFNIEDYFKREPTCDSSTPGRKKPN